MLLFSYPVLLVELLKRDLFEDSIVAYLVLLVELLRKSHLKKIISLPSTAR
jgi:hypothetical protein